MPVCWFDYPKLAKETIVSYSMHRGLGDCMVSNGVEKYRSKALRRGCVIWRLQVTIS